MNVQQIIDRIQAMEDEAEVIHLLRAVNAVRSSIGQTFTFLNSIALPVPEDAEDEIHKLSSKLTSMARQSDFPSRHLDYIEEVLKQRLSTLRKNRN
jgi:hypothetical protein